MLKTNFRPRLGMGWFLNLLLVGMKKLQFSSPLGDGLVPLCQRLQTTILSIFVPEWGWVGSTIGGVSMGENKLFSSPSGDGLVLDGTCFYYTGWTSFSSPSGDGLVQQKHIHIKHIIQIFVPAWGWVGSPQVLLQVQWNLHFRPRVGMGWFASLQVQWNSLHFRPRLGMGWFAMGAWGKDD